MRRALAIALLLALAFTAGCGPAIVRAALSSAPRPEAAREVRFGGAPSLRLWAGDLHFHVSPPDQPDEVHRALGETLALVGGSGLDFVVVTPHVGARFWADEGARAWVKSEWRALATALDAAPRPKPLAIVGLEYTDHRYGHVGVSFVDVPALLDDAAALENDPTRFFHEVARRGGLIIANHPLVTPLDSSFAIARVDLSFRPLTSSAPVTREIAAANALLDGLEVYNVVASQLRDRWLVGDRLATVHATLARLDREILARGRRLVPVGGSDSHERFARATTFIAAPALTVEDLREGLRRGRVCVRAPQPCALEVRADGGSPAGVGDALRATRTLAISWRGEGELYRDGAPLGRFAGEATLPVEDAACHVIRLAAGGGFSGPVYVNCGFAERPPAAP